MKALRVATAIVLLGSPAALGFDPAIEAIAGHYKRGKLVNAKDVGELMRKSERWCYAEAAGQCAWSDIYLAVTDEDARFEISNAWSDTVDVSFIDHGVFNDTNQICETANDWVPTVHARSRPEGLAIGGRTLEAIKAELGTNRDATVDCFDYLYEGSDAQGQIVTLLQRQYTDGVHQAGADVTVSLHFDHAAAAALTLGWQAD